MPTAKLIFNPTAGRFASIEMIAAAAHHLESAGWQIKITQTTSRAHLTEVVRRAVQDGLDGLFVAGGDGSIQQAVAELAGSQTALGILPAGTANVLANELGLPGLTWTHRHALQESARALAAASIQAVDVGLVNGMPFLSWAGVGLDSLIVSKMEGRRHGRRRFTTQQYIASLLWQARSWQGVQLTLDADGEQVSGVFSLAVVSNIRHYAGGLAQISPQACLDDGLMDLWLFSGVSVRETLAHAWRLYLGMHFDAQQIKRIPFRQLKLAAGQPLLAQLDGDPYEFDRHVAVEVQPGALRLLVPSQAPGSLFSQPPLPPIPGIAIQAAP